MIRIVNATNLVVNAQYIAGFAALRHRVFVERLGWSMPAAIVAKGFEYDCFDTSEAVYILICDDEDEVIAGARLLPTTRPCILANLFPTLANGEIPRSETIWEVTRFVVDPQAARDEESHALQTQLVWALHSFGFNAGLKAFVSVSYTGMERLLRNAGCRFRRLGAPRLVDGRRVVALEFDISQDIVAQMHGLVTQHLPEPTMLLPAAMPLPGAAASAPRLAA